MVLPVLEDQLVLEHLVEQEEHVHLSDRLEVHMVACPLPLEVQTLHHLEVQAASYQEVQSYYS